MSDDSVGDDNEALVRGILETVIDHYSDLIAALLEDAGTAQGVVDEAKAWANQQMPGLAYVQSPQHPMARSAFFCHANLAIYVALRQRNVDAHAFGSAMLDALRAMPAPTPLNAEQRQKMLRKLKTAADASQQQAAANEFVFEVFAGDGDGFDWGMNVKSCAICAAYSRHDAMELVPYMCASDDIASDQVDDGLRRSGTIALGAHHCDFRYQQGGTPEPVAAQYPEQIKITTLQ